MSRIVRQQTKGELATARFSLQMDPLVLTCRSETLGLDLKLPDLVRLIMTGVQLDVHYVLTGVFILSWFLLVHSFVA